MDDDVIRWRALADHLRQHVRSGHLAPVTACPQNKPLMQRSGLSRTTVRRAIAQLRLDGLVETRPQHGTFVHTTPGPIHLQPGDSVTAPAALTLTRADGSMQRLPAGTPIIAACPTTQVI